MKLTLDQLDEGRKKALSNSEDLVNDARVLLEHQRWARALFLAQLAAEELGKYTMIASAAVSLIRIQRLDVDIDWDEFWGVFWKRYRHHHEKTSLLIHLEYTFFSDSKAHEYLRKIPSEAQNAEYVKMASLYSDFYDQFLSPKEIITQSLSNLAVRAAERRLSRMKSFDKEILGQNGLLRLRNLSKMEFMQFDEKFRTKTIYEDMVNSYSRNKRRKKSFG
jgi:AbiV family abortive infection protein